MKKTTQKNLSKRLAQYGALTAAIAGVADASGQIIWTDINPDEGGPGYLYSLDINNDTTDDFAIRHFNSSTSGGIGNYNILACGPLNSNNAILGYDAGNFEYPFALSAGEPISAGAAGSWMNVGFQTMNYNSCAYTFSDWCANSGDKFLGLRFDLGGNTHYGWAKISVGATAGDWLIKEYAYNTVADQPILAGQTLGIEDFSPNKFAKITCVDRIVTISQLQGDAGFRVISITGQVVKEGSINLETQDISLETLSSGVYIVEVSDLSSNGVIRKKVAI